MRLSGSQLHPRIDLRVSGRVDALCVYKPLSVSRTTSLFGRSLRAALAWSWKLSLGIRHSVSRYTAYTGSCGPAPICLILLRPVELPAKLGWGPGWASESLVCMLKLLS